MFGVNQLSFIPCQRKVPVSGKGLLIAPFPAVVLATHLTTPNTSKVVPCLSVVLVSGKGLLIAMFLQGPLHIGIDSLNTIRNFVSLANGHVNLHFRLVKVDIATEVTIDSHDHEQKDRQNGTTTRMQ